MKKKYITWRCLCFLFAGLPVLTAAGMARAAETSGADANQELFLRAMADRADGNLYDAVAAFNNILTNNPQLHRARLELAVTYRRLYDYTKAKELAQEVLDDPKTPPNVRVTVQAFIVQLDQDAKEMATATGHNWRPEVGLGWMYDTNVNAGPSNDLYQAGTTLSSSSRPTSDTAAIVNAGLGHQYRTGKSMHVGQSNVIFLWQDYANYNRREYSDEHAFDQEVLTVATGPALVAVHNWRANLSAQADYIKLGSEEMAWFFSLLPSFTKQFANDTWEITLDGGVTSRDYQQNVDSEYDSTYYIGQFSVGYTFPKARVSLQGGASVFQENADAGYYSYDGVGFYGSAAWRPWSSGSIYGRVSERDLEYDTRNPAYGFLEPAARDERVVQYTLGVSHTVKSSRKWLNNLTVAANFVRTENNSNAPVYEFTREQSSVMVSKAF